ncbi:DMT family transporter [Limnohabitans sp.]|uniref:DMT family transporter n=1 Tax=Limnohabitans sp. TaxID=1907725 RepID=UPI00286EF45F|nr:DMT family transporter [Limnohabitans sp.]
MTHGHANLALLLVALIWGITFVPQQLGMAHVGPLTFTSARFLLGALFVLPWAWHEHVQLQRSGIKVTPHDRLSWISLGVLLFLGCALQQIGLLYTTVSNAGFLTALYVPMVPLLFWLLERRQPHRSIWPLAAGSLVGTVLLTDASLDGWRTGDLLVLASTIFWAFHVVLLGAFVQRKPAPFQLSCIQFFACSALAGLLAWMLEAPTVDALRKALPTIAFTGVLSVGISFTLQVFAQRYAHPTHAAILLSSEILFATLAAQIWLGERLSLLQWAGGLLIFVCIVAAQIIPVTKTQR